MLNQKLILGIIIGVTAIGLALLAFQWWILGGILTALGGTFLYFTWRFNQVGDVSKMLMAGDIAGARAKLEKVKNPDRLNPYSRTYHYMLLGQVEVRSNNMKGARSAFKNALEVGKFQTTDEKASVLFMLAQVEFNAENKEAARRLLKEAQELEPSDELMKQIKDVAKMMQQAPANLRMRQQQMQQMRRTRR